MLDKSRAASRAKLIDAAKASCQVTPDELTSISAAQGNDTIYLTAVDRDGNIVSLIQSNYRGFGSGIVPAGMGFMLQNRGGLFTLERSVRTRSSRASGRSTPSFPAFMEKDGVRIGFGIMGGWNQAQAHAQFVANIVDYGMTIQQALEAGRFTKGTFDGCDLEIEELVPGGDARRADEARSRAEGVGRANDDVRDGPGGDEPSRRRPLRRLGAAPRRRRDPRSGAVAFPPATPRSGTLVSRRARRSAEPGAAEGRALRASASSMSTARAGAACSRAAACARSPSSRRDGRSRSCRTARTTSASRNSRSMSGVE